MTTVPAARPAPPPPAARKAPVTSTLTGVVKFERIERRNGERILLWGKAGIGKTSLALQMPGPVATFDLDCSLPRIAQYLPLGLDIRTVPVTSWQDMRDALHSTGWDEIRTIEIDTGTKAEEWDKSFVVNTIPHEKGHKVKDLEGYGFGKGYVYSYDQWVLLLSDLEQHVLQGRNVVIICHVCQDKAPNTDGEDYLQDQPLLQHPGSSSGKTSATSIRLRTHNWVDHSLCMRYDVSVKDGKGTGSGTRTMYVQETPACMAKNRANLQDPIPLTRNDDGLIVTDDGVNVWDLILGTQAESRDTYPLNH